ncbi:oxidoreductase [Nocardioides gansuensis]|uniref:Oxidoreductase n=1 Tax=Nocardioides gansuensis TaxID=2138300 RepID=A0A2T8F6K4_9ACTN|nr:Gfo/Idh/MocA family oxidoreductase [Nocardioides gansuensis]PVG81348.1 oxidoreductase [Nocardioides gansuensis]
MTVPDPQEAPALRWGVLGPGGIATAFADALHARTQSRVVAVGSRDQARASAYASRFGVERVHPGYEALCADPDVDVVYVATPHSHHLEQALMAIGAGKPVLVEKAFTRSRAEAEQVFAAAREAGVFVMEAMWTRFLPHVDALHEVVGSGELGTVVNVAADHGQWFAPDPGHRLFDPALAGGALLDLGVYPVAWAHDFLGVPSTVTAVGTLTDTGVDAQVTMVLDYPDQVQASLHTTLLARTPTTAAISGTTGFVAVDGAFYTPTSFTVHPRGGSPRRYDFAVDHGLAYEAAEVARCLADGLTESPRMTWQDSLDVLGTLDSVRSQVGLVYPGE